MRDYSHFPKRRHRGMLKEASHRRASSSVERYLGFTVIELLVVIGIISMLMSLLLPAVMQARASARKAQCANNLKNISLAMLASADAARRFPASGYYHVNSKKKTRPPPTWVASLLPWLERNDIARQWHRDLAPTDPKNQALAETHIAVLVCSDDITAMGHGDLSYVVNGGIGFTVRLHGIDNCPVNPSWHPLDLNGNGVTCPPLKSTADGAPSDREIFTWMGLFFVESGGSTGTTRHYSIDAILDGTSQTFMLSENVRAGYDPLRSHSNWALPSPNRTSFYFSSAVCKSLKCSQGNVEYNLANAGSERINAALTQSEGGAPWPSSYHVGSGAHFTFADGHLRFVSDSIDGAVYASLFSPQGSKLESLAVRQRLLAEQSLE